MLWESKRWEKNLCFIAWFSYHSSKALCWIGNRGKVNCDANLAKRLVLANWRTNATMCCEFNVCNSLSLACVRVCRNKVNIADLFGIRTLVTALSNLSVLVFKQCSSHSLMNRSAKAIDTSMVALYCLAPFVVRGNLLVIPIPSVISHRFKKFMTSFITFSFLLYFVFSTIWVHSIVLKILYEYYTIPFKLIFWRKR